MKLKLSYLFFLITWLLISCSCSTEKMDPINVGTKKQLFIDEKLIESSRNVVLTMNEPFRTGEILVKADQAWEHPEKGGRISIYSSVLKEDGKIRLWYDLIEPTGSGPYDHNRRVCYAESDDGIHFTKPKLGLNEIDGSSDNNVVLPGVIGGASVWIDPNAVPEHRYKSQSKIYPSKKFRMYSSPDGLAWEKFTDLDIGPGGWDTQSIIFWDESISRYVLFTRHWTNIPGTKDESGDPFRFRALRRLESDDLVRWENDSIVLKPDEKDWSAEETLSFRPPVDYYGAAVFKYPETDDVYIMLAQAFWNYIPLDQEDETGPSTFDVQLLVSRNGKDFYRTGERSPFMRLGPGGSFDSKFVWALPNPIVMNDEIWIYYGGSNIDHNGNIDQATLGSKQLSGISRAVMRLDGFVSIDARYEGGELVTPLIRFSGNKLELNLDTSGGGSAKVEILDEAGNPIEGFTESDCEILNGNSIRMPTTWKSNADLEELAGKTVKIRFILRDCKLYAFQFRE